MVIDDEGWKFNEYERKHKSMMETELTMEHKNTKINGVMEEMKEGNAYVMEESWTRQLECGFHPRKVLMAAT